MADPSPEFNAIPEAAKPLPAAQRSPGAYARYRALVQQANLSPIALRRDIGVTEAEETWAELTELEVAAFGIDPRLLNALLFAHLRYLEMAGVSGVEFDDFTAEERTAYPEFFAGDCVVSADHAAAFMAVACEVPYTQALLWVARAQVQNVRSNLYDGTKAAPAWLFGTLDRPVRPVRAVTDSPFDINDDIPF